MRTARTTLAGLVVGTGAASAAVVVVPGLATTPASAAPAVNATFAWQQVLPDAGAPIAQSSPTEAALDGGGPSVVVGDRAGKVYAFHLSDGSAVRGWPVSTGGAPVDSTPSVAAVDGSGYDSVFVGAGNAANPTVGGYYAFNHSGGLSWFQNATDALGNHGVQASMSVGSLDGVTAVVAPSLGQQEYAMNATTGQVLPGWPFFTADSGFSTPSMVNGQVVEGGDSTAGIAYGRTYTNGGHIRVVNGNGTLSCVHDTNQTVDSSPAVGAFLAGGQTGIVVGTGTYYPGAPDTNTLIAANMACGVVWQANLGGSTTSSPAIGDVLGNGQEQVVEGVTIGSAGRVFALNGANGAVLWSEPTSGQVIGGVVTADLTNSGYNDVLVPTTAGLEVFDGASGQLVATVGQGAIALQSSPLVTTDPNGTIGVTIAGYDAKDEGIVQHYELAGTAGDSLGSRSWPQFHQNSQLTGFLAVPPPGHLNQPIVGMASTGDGKGYWNVASDGGLFAFGDAQFHGSMGGHPLNKPVVGMASTPDGGGYWEVASDGGIFAFGDAQFHGSMGGTPLNQPVVGIASTPDGGGYWEVASDGGIFAFGDAGFYGSMGGTHLNQPVVGIASTPDGKGYWEVARDGGIFAFGDAGFAGSMGGTHLNQPVVGMTSDGHGGYWEVASDGGIFAFGGAPFHGSMGGTPLNRPVVGIASTPDDGGYWEVASDGGIFAFGDAGFYGSMPQVFQSQVGRD